MTVTIRNATQEDAESLRSLYAWYVTNTAITFEYEVPTLDEFTRRISTTLKNYPYLVAEADGKIAGYAYAGRFRSRAAFDWAVETSIYIDRNYHRLGIGKLLYAKLEQILARQHVTNLYACIAEPKTEDDEYLSRNSEHFHTALGYSTVGRLTACGYKFNRWYNLLYMEKITGAHETSQAPFVPFSNLEYVSR
ncbi:MAG: GNAT family N-acetyltransferase [Treponema sp.]|nr:GNAT family N-acetyltransferase [Treponema sp.]